MADPGKSGHVYSNYEQLPAKLKPGIPTAIGRPQDVTPPPGLRQHNVTPPPAHQGTSPQEIMMHHHPLSRPSSRESPLLLLPPRQLPVSPEESILYPGYLPPATLGLLRDTQAQAYFTLKVPGSSHHQAANRDVRSPTHQQIATVSNRDSRSPSHQALAEMTVRNRRSPVLNKTVMLDRDKDNISPNTHHQLAANSLLSRSQAVHHKGSGAASEHISFHQKRMSPVSQHPHHPGPPHRDKLLHVAPHNQGRYHLEPPDLGRPYSYVQRTISDGDEHSFAPGDSMPISVSRDRSPVHHLPQDRSHNSGMTIERENSSRNESDGPSSRLTPQNLSQFPPKLRAKSPQRLNLSAGDPSQQRRHVLPVTLSKSTGSILQESTVTPLKGPDIRVHLVDGDPMTVHSYARLSDRDSSSQSSEVIPRGTSPLNSSHGSTEGIARGNSPYSREDIRRSSPHSGLKYQGPSSQTGLSATRELGKDHAPSLTSHTSSRASPQRGPKSLHSVPYHSNSLLVAVQSQQRDKTPPPPKLTDSRLVPNPADTSPHYHNITPLPPRLTDSRAPPSSETVEKTVASRPHVNKPHKVDRAVTSVAISGAKEYKLKDCSVTLTSIPANLSTKPSLTQQILAGVYPNSLPYHGAPAQVPQLQKTQTNGVVKEEKPDTVSELQPGTIVGKDIKQEKQEVGNKEESADVMNPFNMRVQNLKNFPAAQTGYRATYRSHTVAIHRAKAGCISSAGKSLDLLRQNLQKFINLELDSVIQKYLSEYFQLGLENIKENNNEVVADEHVQAVCRQILEEAKKMYPSVEKRSATPDGTDNISESGSLCENSTVRANKHSLFNIKKRRGSADSDASLSKKKKKGRFAPASGRSTPMKSSKTSEPARREGTKWDPERLKTETQFVMGAKANKALGLGATRGRIYIKHPDIFKYSGDQDDKQWLYENRHMPATGGKAYMLVVDDVKELANTSEYKDSPGLLLSELGGFTVPEWMVAKMKSQMAMLRTDAPKIGKNSGKGPPVTEAQDGEEADEPEADKSVPLPFSSITVKNDERDSQASPDATENMDLMSTCTDQDVDEQPVSPFNITGGFGDGDASEPSSPTPSDLDALESEAPPTSAPFGSGAAPAAPFGIQ